MNSPDSSAELIASLNWIAAAELRLGIFPR
jgi:hypothetical protein